MSDVLAKVDAGTAATPWNRERQRPARHKSWNLQTIGPVAVAPGSKVVAVVFILQSTYCFLQEALKHVGHWLLDSESSRCD